MDRADFERCMDRGGVRRGGCGGVLRHRGRTIRLGFEARVGANLRELRRQTASILEDARHLRDAERALLEEVFGEGRSVASIARRMGVRERLLRSRVHRVVARMRTAMFRYVVARSEEWSAEQRRVAVGCIVQGLPLRAVAAEVGITFHRARQHVLRVRAMLEAEVARVRAGARGEAA